jgi:hypothetical protein
MKAPTLLITALIAVVCIEIFAIEALAQTPQATTAAAGAWQKRSSFLRGRIFHSAVWTYAEMIVWGGGADHQFYNDGGIYDPITDKWRAVSLEGAPSGRWGHAAVWTGTEMIVWGGRNAFTPAQHHSDGAIFNPATNRWRPMSAEGAPSPRSQMAAVWTGDELIVWGGWSDGGECPASGGRYHLGEDRWTPLPMEGAPEGRIEPASVWTGRELIVWGGLLKGEARTASTGGRFDPETKTWKPLPMENAPISARGLQAFWTGTEMVLWGGAHLDGESRLNVGLNAGARYNPATNAWRATQADGAPDGRLYYAGAWTGTELIVWGGGDQTRPTTATGGRYNPEIDQWLPIQENEAPPGRSFATAVWTGEGILFFGGSTGGVEAFDETYFYRPPPAN